VPDSDDLANGELNWQPATNRGREVPEANELHDELEETDDDLDRDAEADASESEGGE
jgi:hypothetical protein